MLFWIWNSFWHGLARKLLPLCWRPTVDQNKLKHQKYSNGNLDDFLLGMAEWLGYDGTAFVCMLIEEYGTEWGVACWNHYGIPHSVHFREGMAIRNYMRKWAMFNQWDDHQFDDNWAYYTQVAAEKCARGDL